MKTTNFTKRLVHEFEKLGMNEQARFVRGTKSRSAQLLQQRLDTLKQEEQWLLSYVEPLEPTYVDHELSVVRYARAQLEAQLATR